MQRKYRRSARRQFVSLDAMMLHHNGHTLPDEVSQKETAHRIRQLIQTLSPRRREIIRLRYYGELSNQEIAAILKLDERTVASHLSRGLRDLQKKFAEEQA